MQMKNKQNNVTVLLEKLTALLQIANYVFQKILKQPIQDKDTIYLFCLKK